MPFDQRSPIASFVFELMLIYLRAPYSTSNQQGLNTYIYKCLLIVFTSKSFNSCCNNRVKCMLIQLVEEPSVDIIYRIFKCRNHRCASES